ncbi:MAG: hypothetical protein PHG66_06540 [Candidatus Colwellbacteria bacterium]|nr:hypothetical protein [Candidatus Colwellbacteria bacterium]
MTVKGNTQVVLENRGMVTLRPDDHKATGGEGSVYKVANTIIKIYLDPKKMIAADMVNKIRALSTIKHDYIVSPRGVVTTPTGDPIGFYMDFADGEPLARVFTNAYRLRQGFTDDQASIVVERMRDTLSFAHGQNAVLGDLNELNWLMLIDSDKKPSPRIIDVDSWAIGRWPVTAIMPSIRDWHTQGFNSLTDWFSWGIVTFQIYTGIHPYKGSLAGYKVGDFESRMKSNASVFTPGIGLNQAVRDFSCVPTLLLEWYRSVFQEGERVAPPSPFDVSIKAPKAARIKKVVITGVTGALIFDKLFGDPLDKVIRIFPCGVVMSESGKLIDLNTKKEIGRFDSRDCELIRVEGGWLKADLKDQAEFTYIHSSDSKEERLDLAMNAYKIVRYENRLFAVTDHGLTEVNMKMFGRPIMSVGNTWGAMLNSTAWFEGVGIQDTMGAMFLITPFNGDACAHTRVHELDGLRIITAKAGNRFVSIIAMDKNGLYKKIELTFSADYSSYKSWVGATDSPDLNLAILPKGVCATVVNDGELIIFVPTNGNIKKIQDKDADTQMQLGNWDNKVVYIRDGSIWSLTMR